MNIFKKFSAVLVIILCFSTFDNANSALTQDQTDQRLLQISESNGIADSLGNGVKLATGAPMKVFLGSMIFVTGIGVLLGKVTPGLFLGLTVGIGGVFGSASILETLSGTDKTKGGAKCQTEKIIAYNYDAKGYRIPIIQSTGLTSDCKKKP